MNEYSTHMIIIDSILELQVVRIAYATFRTLCIQSLNIISCFGFERIIQVHHNDTTARVSLSFTCIITHVGRQRKKYAKIHICVKRRACSGGALEGHRVSQYLIVSGYECCLDTSEIARRKGLESGAEMGNRRKEGRENSFVVCNPKSRGNYTSSAMLRARIIPQI